MQRNIAQITGKALDWAVLRALGYEDAELNPGGMVKAPTSTEPDSQMVWLFEYNPSTDWADGGPLIDEAFIEVSYLGTGEWKARCWDEGGRFYVQTGTTSLEAVARVYVDSKIGADIDISENAHAS